MGMAVFRGAKLQKIPDTALYIVNSFVSLSGLLRPVAASHGLRTNNSIHYGKSADCRAGIARRSNEPDRVLPREARPDDVLSDSRAVRRGGAGLRLPGACRRSACREGSGLDRRGAEPFRAGDARLRAGAFGR